MIGWILFGLFVGIVAKLGHAREGPGGLHCYHSLGHWWCICGRLSRPFARLVGGKRSGGLCDGSTWFRGFKRSLTPIRPDNFYDEMPVFYLCDETFSRGRVGLWTNPMRSRTLTTSVWRFSSSRPLLRIKRV